jgi:hypothetical protein
VTAHPTPSKLNRWRSRFYGGVRTIAVDDRRHRWLLSRIGDLATAGNGSRQA